MPQLSEAHKNLLESIYYNNSGTLGAFSALNPLYKAAKRRDKTISYKIVRTYLHSLTPYLAHKRVLRRFRRRSILSLYPGNVWSIDLLDYSKEPYLKKKYVLCVHDVFSHMSYAAPLATKSPVEVLARFKEILNSASSQPLFLLSDRGRRNWIVSFFRVGFVSTFC